MSFSMSIGQILQYAYNIFASSQAILYLFIGASFGIYVLNRLLATAKG